MCLVRMKVEHEEDETPSPPRRIVIHPVSQHGSERIIVASSRPVSRAHSHRSSQRSSRIISVVEPIPAPAPRPSNYILSHTISAPSAPSASATTRVYDYRRSTNLDPRASIPRIIHAAPSPPRSPRLSNSPRVSHTSVHSSLRNSSNSRRNSISGAAGAGSGNSPRGSRTRIVSENGEIVYISTERERERERERGDTEVSRRRSTRGSSGQFLTTAAAAMAMTGAGGSGGAYDRDEDVYAEPAARQNMFLDDRDGGGGGGGSRIRSRSITYATTGSARLSRERVLVEEGGRRREIYQVVGGGK